MSSKLPLFLGGLALVVALILSPLASASPDGLERVAKDYGFAEKSSQQNNNAPFAGYLYPGLENRALATGAAGVTGTIMTFGGMYLLGKILRKS